MDSDTYHVCAVADFLLLRLRRHDEQLGSGVLHLQLLGDGGRVIGHKQLLEVIDHHLVHACRAAHARNVKQLCNRAVGVERRNCRRYIDTAAASTAN